MTTSLTARQTINVAGRNFVTLKTVSADGYAIKDVSITAAKTGTLTTRTDANTGTLTMSSGHGITDGQIIDIYWNGGVQRTVTVGTVSTNSVPIDLGIGDDLPSTSTAVTVHVQVEETFLITGSDVQALVFEADQLGTIILAASDNTEILAQTIGSSTSEEGKAYVWLTGRDGTNPVTGDSIAKAIFTNSSSTTAANMRVLALFS